MFSTLLGQATQLILNLRRAAAQEEAGTFSMTTTPGTRSKPAKGLMFAQPSRSDTIRDSTVFDIVVERPT
jgi:hypothetical protein